jgi:hypothetical protein
VCWGLLTRRYRGAANLMPLCAIGTITLLLLQNQGVMEARFREPVDAILVCSALLIRSLTRCVTSVEICRRAPGY